MGICSSQNKSTKTHCRYAIIPDQVQDFKFQHMLGKGGFGQVWKVIHKDTQKVFALKILDKARMISKKSVKSILSERLILSILLKNNSKGIIKLQSCFQDKKKLYILMQFIQGKTLREMLASQYIFQQNQQKFIILALAKILQSLFQNTVIHHDFKPENIVFDRQSEPHLIDFGLSTFNYEDNSCFSGGTLEYQAPEILEYFDHSYTADYYSLGVITYELFFKKRPYSSFSHSSLKEIMMQKPFNEENFPEINGLSPEAKDFVVRLLEKTQTKRLGFGGIHQIIQHPWMKDSSRSMLFCSISDNFRQSTKIQKNDQTLLSKTNTQPTSFPIISNLLQEEYVQDMFKNFDYPVSPAKHLTSDIKKVRSPIKKISSLT